MLVIRKVTYVTNQKVTELNGIRQKVSLVYTYCIATNYSNGVGSQMVQVIAQDIKQEIHKQSTVPQDEQKFEPTLDDKEELQHYKMSMREIIPYM